MNALHLDLDSAWSAADLPMPTLDLRNWGAPLRYCTTREKLDAFYEEIQPQLASFLLYGSGDFHHLTALWLRAIQRPFTLISFDNHPDWDRRPPLWQCGAWINRALELPNLTAARIWAPASPDVHGLGRRFANPRALKSGRLAAFPYAPDWLETFALEAARLADEPVYVTVDLDCLNAENAVTNWDQGRSTAEEIATALTILRNHTEIIGGDICGAWSEAIYERPFQRFAARIDHDELILPSPEQIRLTNLDAFQKIWPILTETNSQKPATRRPR